MARPASKHPTQLELEILKVLWRHKSLTVRAVRDGLAEHRALAYTTVMTMMNIMVDKGYLSRRKVGGTFAYSTRIRQGSTLRGMIRDLVDRVFDGSAAEAMVNLLEVSELEEREIKELRQMLRRKAGEGTK